MRRVQLDLDGLFRRAVIDVDRILKGAKPAELPIEQPTQYRLVLNMKTAKALGLTIPQSFRLRADRFSNEVLTMLTRTATVFTLLVVLAAASALGAQPLDPTATEALATTLKTLIDPSQRSSAIAGNPQATSIDQQVRSLTGSEALTQDFYALALDVFSELTVAAGGDITKLSEILDRGKTDPAGLIAMLSPQTQERLRQFSVKISDQKK
jgi:hypothetical protein